MKRINIKKLLMACCLMVYLHTSYSLRNTSLANQGFLTTEMMYSSKAEIFTGKYSSVRQLLDYDYHSHYLPSRQLVQDKIIDSYLTNIEEKTCHSPTVIFMAGVMGAGKSHSLKYLDFRTDFQLADYVLIDPDKIKYELPEMLNFIEEDPSTAGDRTHKESGYIAEIIQNEALRQHVPIIVDGSLRDKDWNETLIAGIRSKYPRYRIGLIYVSASLGRVIDRVQQRRQDTGRAINLELLEETAKQVPNTVEHLKRSVNFFVKIKNEVKPTLLEEENISFTPCWQH